jgi:hypothetical protein
MFNSQAPAVQNESAETDRIVASGPRGAVALASIATAIVIAIWLAFYFFVFIPRGPLE